MKVKTNNPEDEVVHLALYKNLDLYKADIPYLDTDVFNGWKKLRSQSSLQDLSTDERLKVARLAELSGQF